MAVLSGYALLCAGMQNHAEMHKTFQKQTLRGHETVDYCGDKLHPTTGICIAVFC